MSIRWEEVEVFDATDLDQNGMPGQRSYNSSAGTSVQAIADAQLIDGRLVAANSIGQFSRLTEVDPDMGQILFDYAADLTLSNEDFFTQILDLHEINGISQYVKDFTSIDNANMEKMRWVQTPQDLKDFMLAGGYRTRDLRDLEKGKNKSFMEKAFSLSFIPDSWGFGKDIAEVVGAVGGAVGTPIRWTGRSLWGSLEASQDFLGHNMRTYMLAQEDTKIWDPTWLNPAKYFGKGGFRDRAKEAASTWTAEDIDKINDTFADEKRRWLATETLGYGDSTGRLSDLIDEQFEEEGIVADQYSPEWGERYFELYDLMNTQEWAELYNEIGAGAYAGAAPGSMESFILRDYNSMQQFGFMKMKPGSAPAQMLQTTVGMTYRVFYDPVNIAFMGVGTVGQAGVIAGKAMLTQTDDMVRLLRMANATDNADDVLRLKDTWRVGDDGIFTAEQLGLEVGETVKVKDLVRAVRQQAEKTQYGDAIVNAAKGTNRPTTAQVATALKYGRFSYLATPQSIRDVMFLRKIKQINGTLGWLSKSYKQHFYLKTSIEAIMKLSGDGKSFNYSVTEGVTKLKRVDYHQARQMVLDRIEALEGAGVRAEYETAWRNLYNTNAGIRRLLPSMTKWQIERLEAGLEGFGEFDDMLDFLQQNLTEVLAHTNQLSPRGFRFPTVSARQRFQGREKTRVMDASDKGRNFTPEQMDNMLGHGVTQMRRRIDDTAEELARSIEQNFEPSPASLVDDGVITPLDNILARLNDEQRAMLKEVFSDPDSRTVQMIREIVRTRGVTPVPLGEEAKVRMIDQILRRNYKTNIKFAEGVNADKRLKLLSNFIDELMETTVTKLKKEYEINDIYGLSTRPDGLGRLSRYGRASREFVTNPLRAFGILLRNARYAPKGGPIALDTVGGFENMMRYFDMGYLAHLPDEVIEAYQIKYLYGTPGERLNIATEFVSDFLSNSGLLSISDPSIERMYLQWVKRMEHTYGVSGADAINVMEDTNRAVFKSEMANMMLLPDIHQMMKASRHLGWWRRIGFSPPASVINSMVGTYWKPAVLIRMGFIPKTAGEEAFSFILRNGVSDYLAAKLGPRGASLYKAYDPRTGKRIWYDGKNLQQLERYRRASVIKPILWYLRSFGPKENKLRKIASQQLAQEHGQAWLAFSEVQQQDLIYKRLSMILNNASDIPVAGKAHTFNKWYVYNVNMFDEWARQQHRWYWERIGEKFHGRSRSYNPVRPSTPNVTNPKRTTGKFTDRVTDPETGIQYDLPPEQWVKAKQRTDRLAEKVATNLVGPEHVEYLVKAARIWHLHPTARNASANVMASTVSKGYTGETTAEQLAREGIDYIDGFSPDHVHLSLGYDRHIFETMPNPAQVGLADTSPMLGADFPRATYILGWRIADDPAAFEAAKVLLNANPKVAGDNARNTIRTILGTDAVAKDPAQFYQMFVRELDYMPFDLKGILRQAHRRSPNGHAWDNASPLVAPHNAQEAKLLSKEERMRKAMSERDYAEARRVGAEVPAGHEWNWLDDLSDEEFAVYERINYIFSQATDWDPSVVERIQLGEALGYEELFTMPSEGALAQMFSDDMLAKPLDQWIDVYKTLARDRTLTAREANAINLSHWTMFPQTSRYGVHRYIPVKPLAGLDKSAPLPGIGSNTKWVPAAEGTADGALDSIRTGNTYIHTGDTLVPELPVPRLDIFRNDLDGQNILNGLLVGNKEQRLMLYNIQDMDMHILTTMGDDPALLRAHMGEASYSKLIQPMYSSQIDESARMSSAVEGGRPADHTSLYVPIVRTEIVESFVSTLQDPDISIEFAEFLANKLRSIPNQRRALTTSLPIGELNNPEYAKLFADEIVDLLNPLNDPISTGLGPEIYSTVADDALEMMSLVDDTNGVYFPTMIMLNDPDTARVVSEAITEFASVKQMGKTGITFTDTPALSFARVDVHSNAFTGKTKMNLPKENSVLGIPDGTEIQVTDDVVAEIQGFNRDIKPNYRHDPYAPNNHPLYRSPDIGVYGTSHRADSIWPASPWEGEGFASRPVFGTSDMASLELHPVVNGSDEFIEISILSGPNKGARKTISQEEYMIYIEDWPKVRAMTSDDFTAEILYPHDLDPTGKAYGMSKMGMNSLRRGASATDPIPIFINFDAILGWANRRIVTQGADSYSSIAIQALHEMGIDPNMMFAYLSSPNTKIIAGELSFADEFLELANKWLKNLYGDEVDLLTTTSRLEDSLAEAAFIWEHEIAHARLNHVRKERRVNPVAELTVTGVKEQMANSMALKKMGIPDEALSTNPEEIMYMIPDDHQWVETGRFLGTGGTQDQLIRKGANAKTDGVWDYATKPLRAKGIDTTSIGDVSWPLLDNILDPDIARFNMTARLDDMPWEAHGPQAVISSQGAFQNIVNTFFEGIASPLMNALIREPLWLENFALALRETEFIRRTFQHSPTAFTNLKSAKGLVGRMIRVDDIGQVRSDDLEEIITHGMMNPEQMPDVVHIGMHDMVATGTITAPTEPNYMKKLVVGIINRDRSEVAKYLEPAIEQKVLNRFNPTSLGKQNADEFMLVVDDFMDWAWHESHVINEQIKVASSNAVGKTIPWIDDHTLRPMFQELVGNVIPFWFAHEQFLRRMARGLIANPQMYRNLEAGITVGGNVGFIREDSFGEKRLYMPVLPTVANLVHGGWDGVSDLAGKLTVPQVEAAMLWAGDSILQPWEQPIGWPMKSMLPGWDASKVHQPGAGPIITIPLVGISQMLPEFAPLFADLTYFRYSGSTAVDENSALASMLNSLVGIGFIKHVIPAGMTNIGMTESPFGMKDAGEALTAGAVLMNMLGELPDEESYYLDKAEYQEGIRQHARNILNMRAFTWFWGPGAAQMEPLIGDEPLRFSREFQDMLDVASRTGAMGWEELYVELFERYVNDAKAEHGEDWRLHAPPHRFQLFVTGKQTTTATGAPLPPTEPALEYINDNEQFITDYKFGASYLVPASWTEDEEYSALSAQRMVALDLRHRIEWDDLVESWYLGADNQEYHLRTGEMDRIILDNDYKIKRKGIYRGTSWSSQEIKNFQEIIKRVKAEKEAFVESFTNLHPIFAYGKSNPSTAEGKRARTIDDFKVILQVYDEAPELIPESENRDDILEFARVLVSLSETMDDLKNRQGGTDLRKQARRKAVNEMERMRRGKPWLNSLYYTVGRPLIGEDEFLKIEFDPYYGVADGIN